MEQQQQQERNAVFSGSAQDRQWNSDDDDPQQPSEIREQIISDIVQTALDTGEGIQYGGHGGASIRHRHQYDITSAFLDGTLDNLSIREQNAVLLEALCSDEDAEIPQYLTQLVQELQLDDEKLLRILLTTPRDSSDSSFRSEDGVTSDEEVQEPPHRQRKKVIVHNPVDSGEPSNEAGGEPKDPPEWLLQERPRQRPGLLATAGDDKASSMRNRGNVNKGLPAPAQFRTRKSKKKDKSRSRAMKWERSKPSREEAKALKKKYRRFDSGYKEFSKKTVVTAVDVANSLRRSGEPRTEGPPPENIAGATAAEKEIRESRRVSELLEDGGLGYIPREKETQYVRVAFENVNSIGPRWKVDKLNKDIIPSLEVDVFMFNELQRDWRVTPKDEHLSQVLTPGVAKRGVIANNTTERSLGRDQPGGTGILALGRISDLVTEMGQDTTGLGSCKVGVDNDRQRSRNKDAIGDRLQSSPA
eukprot:scaffold10329_cov66-Cyclotella_meneghiniana.AAC.7